jgi:hypothetical protein
LRPFAAFPGGLPSDEKAGNRPPGETHTPFGCPVEQETEQHKHASNRFEIFVHMAQITTVNTHLLIQIR